MARIILMMVALFAISANRAYGEAALVDSVYVFDPCTGDTTECPPPVTYAGDIRLPPFAHMHPVLSPNGKKLAFVANDNQGAWTMDLKTLKQDSIKASAGLPGEVDFAWGDPTWCPYDSDLIVVAVASTIGANDFENVCLYRISTGVSANITPTIAGANGVLIVQIIAWLPHSTPGHDSLLISMRRTSADTNFYGLYIPQTQKLIPMQPWDTGYEPFYSQDSLHIYSQNYGHFNNDTCYGVYGPFLIDSKPIGWPPEIASHVVPPASTPEYYFPNGPSAFFSPNDTFCALLVTPYCPASELWPELIIYKVSDPSKPFNVINFQKDFCTYSFWGVDPVFLTDSTIAVSMHHDGNESSPLWEISVDGNIIRQLTFLPEYPSSVASASVPANSLSLISYPDPITSNTIISVTLPEASAVHLTLTDAAGREVLLLPAACLGAGEHAVTWDASNYPSGVYLCRIEAGGQRATRRVVVIH